MDNKIVEMIKRIFEDSENAKITKEKYEKDDNDIIVSSTTKILTTEEKDTPLIMKKKWNYNENGKVTSITGRIIFNEENTEETPKKMFGRKSEAEAENMNPVNMEQVLSEYIYDKEGRCIASIQNNKQQVVEYFEDGRYRIIDTILGTITSKTFDKDGRILEESKSYNIPDASITTTEYKYISSDCREYKYKCMSNNKVVLSKAVTEKKLKGMEDTYYITDATITKYDNDINTFHIHIVEDTEQKLVWEVSNSDNKVIFHMSLENNIFKCDDFIIENLFSINKITKKKFVSINSHSTKFFDFWVFDTPTNELFKLPFKDYIVIKEDDWSISMYNKPEMPTLLPNDNPTYNTISYTGSKAEASAMYDTKSNRYHSFALKYKDKDDEVYITYRLLPEYNKEKQRYTYPEIGNIFIEISDKDGKYTLRADLSLEEMYDTIYFILWKYGINDAFDKLEEVM